MSRNHNIPTCRDSKTIIENLPYAKVSKNRIHACVQTVGEFMNQKRQRKKLSNNATTTTEKKEEEKADRRRKECLI
ncbi:MAG: hypothetical protein FWC14_05895 [Candidatus Bathyarchaeota archaeon]|uniref:hypothetical protein n=1 Tax=Candidatus Bathycorpusculum sp. TaxID=2994959 RepID=UPI0028205B6F|nr:hypothetical protein [Candidatus Termiticorpusculum sp.]MCL2292163.1 hypothetical protein [Candidatus Termiticorpusculum sp.]